MSPVLRLVRSEQRLFRRDPVGLLFVVAFPVLVVLLIAGSFEPDDPSFGGAPPADYYLASCLGVVLRRRGVRPPPSHLAGYRGHGVVRRFAASHGPGWALPTAWGVVAASLCLLGVGTVVATMALAYGLPAMADPVVVVLALVLGIAMCISIGLVLGMLLPVGPLGPRASAWSCSSPRSSSAAAAPRRHAWRHADRRRRACPPPTWCGRCNGAGSASAAGRTRPGHHRHGRRRRHRRMGRADPPGPVVRPVARGRSVPVEDRRLGDAAQTVLDGGGPGGAHALDVVEIVDGAA